MNTIPMEDINYLAQQSSEKINMILAGMTALMNDTDNKVASLESQNWFQRMAKTITGKNKMTKNEIQQNHDKLNAYMSEAIAELYNRNCIDQAVMMSLGTQINELYADHVQLKQMLGSFVSKLNAKIDSVDNFHILNTEIEQGVYSGYAPIVAMCKIMAQFDNRVLDEERKIDILKRSMEAENIINDEEVPLANYLMTIVDVPVDEIGAIYLELGTIRNNFLANIMLKTIEQYHFLSDMARKMKKKENIVANVIQSEELDDSVTLASSYIFEEFINSKIDAKNGFVTIEVASEQMREVSPTITEETQDEQQQYTEQDTKSDIDIKDLTRKGIAAHGKGKYELAVRYYSEAAELGDPEAQNRLGSCYEYGLGVDEDEKIAVYWYIKASKRYHGEAMCNLAECFYYGRYVDEDEELAEALLLISTAREIATEKLEEWFDVDFAEDDSYAYHDSLNDAFETLDYFWKNTAPELLHSIETEEDEDSENSSDENQIDRDLVVRNVYEMVALSCRAFAPSNNEDTNARMRKTLGIDDKEEIYFSYDSFYLSHDTSVLQKGQNGFAITENGIYCKKSEELYYMSFEEFVSCEEIYIEFSEIYADGKMIATTNGRKLDDLLDLFKSIKWYMEQVFAD